MDAWGVDFDKLNDVEFLTKHLQAAADACGATILSIQKQQFEPQGATVLLMLSESHLSIHTYPEKGFAALDCYTCGHTVDPNVAIQYMIEILKPTKTYSKTLRRGDGPVEVIKSESKSARVERTA